MDSQALLQLLQLLPNLALPIASLIRDLLNSSGYDVDRLLSAGTALNQQTLTHVESEINRVKGLLGQKGGDPASIVEVKAQPSAAAEVTPAPAKKK